MPTTYVDPDKVKDLLEGLPIEQQRIAKYLTEGPVFRALRAEIKRCNYGMPSKPTVYRWAQEFIAHVVAQKLPYTLGSIRDFVDTKYPKLFPEPPKAFEKPKPPEKEPQVFRNPFTG